MPQNNTAGYPFGQNLSRLGSRAAGFFERIPLPALLCVIVLAFFLPALKNGFVDWDDVQYILANQALRGSWLDALGFSPGYYHPLTTLTYKLEFSIFGTSPLSYHITNLVLHLINCASVFYLVAALGARRRVAFLAALLFGLHPVHVEPVAWASGRKELLWGFFSIWTLIFYLRYSGAGSRKHYACSLFMFLLAILSKPFAVVIPLLLPLADLYRGRALNIRLFLEKVPYAALALPLLTLSTGTPDFLLKSGGASVSAAGGALAAAGNAAFYAQRLLLPVNLSALYPPAGLTGNAPGILMLLLAAAGAARSLRKPELPASASSGPGLGRTALFGLGFFLTTLIPALLVSPPADRYDYLPSLGLFLIYGELVSRGYDAARSLRSGYAIFLGRAVPFALAAHLLVLGFISAARIPVWKDSLSLWEDVLRKYPLEYVAYYGRGNAHRAAGEHDKALLDLTRCLELAPTYWKAYNNRGRLFADRGDYDKAITDYGKAISLKPDDPRLLLNRGNAYFLKGDAALAQRDYNRALAIAPHFAPALENNRRAAGAPRPALKKNKGG
ncbi:MAG TPA: hypothetical protein DCS63_01065 [Elusimicrobia bacterium]|nr:hypothetical protein [Elusimicrobiota bacterium]